MDALLNGARLREVIHEHLPTDPADPLVDDLVAYLTMTDLAGDQQRYLDGLNHKILVINHRGHRQFKTDDLRRMADETPQQYRDRLSTLAGAARATSAFPGAPTPSVSAAQSRRMTFE